MVLIVGCGYVGTQVALALKSKLPVVVTARSDKHLEELRSSFAFVEHLDTNNLEEFERVAYPHEAIIVTVAAKDMNSYQQTYLKTAENLAILLFKNTSVKQIIYTSSTSVYGDQAGNVVDETTLPQPSSEQSSILLETERQLLACRAHTRKVCIFRLGEIYGPSREISSRVKHYQGKFAPGDGSFPTNMIHIDDISRAITFALQHSLEGVYNLCDDDHMPRSELYNIIASKFHLPQVKWDPSQKNHHSSKKIISSEKIKRAGFVFIHPKRQLI
jgi:nucleoside-diphosphate-sugar epimerase